MRKRPVLCQFLQHRAALWAGTVHFFRRFLQSAAPDLGSAFLNFIWRKGWAKVAVNRT